MEAVTCNNAWQKKAQKISMDRQMSKVLSCKGMEAHRHEEIKGALKVHLMAVNALSKIGLKMLKSKLFTSAIFNEEFQ